METQKKLSLKEFMKHRGNMFLVLLNALEVKRRDLRRVRNDFVEAYEAECDDEDFAGSRYASCILREQVDKALSDLEKVCGTQKLKIEDAIQDLEDQIEKFELRREVDDD